MTRLVKRNDVHVKTRSAQTESKNLQTPLNLPARMEIFQRLWRYHTLAVIRSRAIYCPPNRVACFLFTRCFPDASQG
jgi:hypothetical protein